MGKKCKENSKLFSIGIIIIACQIITGILVFDKINSSEWDKVYEKEETIMGSIKNGMDNTIDVINYNMDRTNALFRDYEYSMTKEQYENFMHWSSLPVKSIVETYFWMPKIYYDYKMQYEDFCKKNIISTCYIFQSNESNPSQFIPVPKRDYYYPIIYAEPPLATGNTYIGYDMTSTVSSRRFINIAKQSVNLTSSHRTNSLAKKVNPNSYEILLSKFAFRNMTHPNMSDVIGIHMTTININNMINGIIKINKIEFDRDDFDLFIFDVTENDIMDKKELNISLLYKEINSEYRNIWFDDDMKYGNMNFSVIHKLHYILKNRQWNIYFKFKNVFRDGIKENISMIILISISGLSVLVNVICVILYILFHNLKIKAETEKQKKIIANQMLGYVNHEIRNPLNGISGLVELSIDTLNSHVNIFDDDFSYEKFMKYKRDILETVTSDLQTAGRSCTLLKHIVNDILDIRKLEEGKVLLSIEKMKIERIIINLKRTIVPLLNEKPDVKFQIISQILSYEIMLDPHRLMQILLNLLSNAIKFTTKGHIYLKIYVENNNIIFMVEDTGRGIPNNKKMDIFQPFHQTESADSTRYGGIGLGLYLCHMLSKCMKGHIYFTSEYGKGTRFFVTFQDTIIVNKSVDSERIDINKIKMTNSFLKKSIFNNDENKISKSEDNTKIDIQDDEKEISKSQSNKKTCDDEKEISKSNDNKKENYII